MIKNIRKRQLELNKPNKHSNLYYATYSIVRENHNLSQANTVFNHILELDSNIDNSIKKSVDLLMELYDTHDKANVNRYRQKVLESISKVRDASEFKNHIQRKMALHKGRIKNKVNNTIDDAVNKVKNAADEVKKKIGTSSSEDDNKNDEVKQETLEMIYKVACENVTYDRIIKNYNKIGKRFNFDKIVIEKVRSKDDAIREAYTVSKFIDTYDIKDIDKFKITVENYLFVLDKNACQYDAIPVIEAVADYFLINASNKIVYIESLENTLNDMANYNPLTKSDIGHIIKNATKTIDDPTDVHYLLDDRYTGVIDKHIAKFKFNPSLDEFKSMLGNILVSIGLRRYISHIGEIFSLIDSINSDSSQYVNILLDFNSLAISSYEESDKDELVRQLIDVYTKYKSRIDSDIDNVINDLQLAVSPMTESYSESPLVIDAKLSLIESSLERINRNYEDANTIIRNSIDSFSLNDIEFMTNDTINKPSFINRDSLQDALTDELKTYRKKYYKTCDEYIRIDCIKDNLNKLKDIDMKKDNDLSLDEAIIVSKENEVLSSYIIDSKYYPSVVKEMNILNTISVASDKIKSKINDIDKSIINIGRQFDTTLDQLKTVVDSPELDSENREAVITGNILPKASRIIKLAIGSGVGYLINPAISVVMVLGYLGSTFEARSKERRKVLDEIEVELEMTKRYLKKAEDDNNLEKQRELLKIKKKLESQKARLTYNMIFKHGETVPNKEKDDD